MTTAVPARPSAGGRAAVAVLLLLGFYLIGLGIVAALVAADFWLISRGRVPGRAIFFTGVIAFGILRGMFFVERRGEADEVTGVAVTDAEEPRLWATVREVAAALGTEPPARLYLVPDVNAFVFQRSRFLGLVPGERVMGIGVPLLEVLTPDEMGGVLAHEFGHYTGGDTRLGPLVYRGRASIGRTIHHLGDNLVAKVFEAYGNLYLRVSQAVSRRQELAADANAAHLVGAPAHASALRKVHVAGAAFDEFVERYAGPLWEAGRRPAALYEGFRLFHDHPDHEEGRASLAERIAARETDRYDSHPSLGTRLAALGATDAPAPDDTARAVDLLADPARTDDRMSALVSRVAARNGSLVPVAWDDEAAEAISAPFATSESERLHTAVAQVTGGTPGGIGGALALVEEGRLADLALAVEPRLAQVADEEARQRIARDVVTRALAGAVAAALTTAGGWRWSLRWNDSAALVSPKGVEWDFWAAAEEAVADPAKVASLRRALKTRGIAV
ncbi:MAG TPA: M48 family metallopeptidase [Frankiaceae bacterium]|nr:M48 family metallopeptidase [Frankiaceae bacterium]